jgi:hypothetical protein
MPTLGRRLRRCHSARAGEAGGIDVEQRWALLYEVPADKTRMTL